MEHIISFKRGIDCIKFNCVMGSDRCKPGSGGSHGRHGLDIVFIVKGDKGAVQFIVATDWLPKYQKPDEIGYRNVDWGSSKPYPMNLGYHSKVPSYEGHKPSTDSCIYCDGQPCYSDWSGLNASDAMYALVNGGDEALWNFLEKYYLFIFEGKDYPQPAEYPASLRLIKTDNVKRRAKAGVSVANRLDCHCYINF